MRIEGLLWGLTTSFGLQVWRAWGEHFSSLKVEILAHSKLLYSSSCNHPPSFPSEGFLHCFCQLMSKHEYRCSEGTLYENSATTWLRFQSVETIVPLDSVCVGPSCGWILILRCYLHTLGWGFGVPNRSQNLGCFTNRTLTRILALEKRVNFQFLCSSFNHTPLSMFEDITIACGNECRSTLCTGSRSILWKEILDASWLLFYLLLAMFVSIDFCRCVGRWCCWILILGVTFTPGGWGFGGGPNHS